MAVRIPLTLLLLITAIFRLLASCCAAKNVLLTGETLYPDEAITEGAYVFKMQSDCNLVLYDHGIPIWASNTSRESNSCLLTMQPDGNLVVYDKDAKPIWASNTGMSEGHYVCVLQIDRNVVIYGGAKWATGTNTGRNIVLDPKIENTKKGKSFVVVNSEGESSGGKSEMVAQV